MILKFYDHDHTFHMVEESPWPLTLSLCIFSLFLSLFIFFLILFLWGKDIVREGTTMGYHSVEIEDSLKWSMGWFITSEVFFFMAFFWAFFTFSFCPPVEIGGVWPPLCVNSMNPFGVPLLNTLILLSSGVSLTWSHHSILSGDFLSAFFGLLITISLGIYFTVLQIMEYEDGLFTLNDSCFGSVFFLATGFHGFHVIVGSILLSISSFRMFKNTFSSSHHMGFESASWYWHFVDIVWLFLWTWVYWWGG